MDLISLVVVLNIVGVLLWLLNTYIPMDGRIKNIQTNLKKKDNDFLAMELSYSTADVEKTIFYGTEYSVPDDTSLAEPAPDKTTILVIHGEMYVLEN